MSKDTRPPLLIREQYKSILMSLSDNERGKILSALMAYQWDGELPAKLSDKLSGVFLALKCFADSDVQKYEETCERNRQKALTRWQNERCADK